jgi:hypothetical protein
MHIHIEQHIIALVGTNAREADRVDIGSILHLLPADVKSPAETLANSRIGSKHDAGGFPSVSLFLI